MCRETCGKSISHRSMLIQTSDLPFHLDEAYFSGCHKNGKGSRMRGDSEEDADEHEIELIYSEDDLPPDADENEDDFVQFGVDDQNWRWVIVIYQAPNSVIFERVSNRKIKTLSAVIAKYVQPGSEVHTDCWSGYNCLDSPGYVHKTVNHSTNLVDFTTKAHTQGVGRG